VSLSGSTHDEQTPVQSSPYRTSNNSCAWSGHGRAGGRARRRAYRFPPLASKAFPPTPNILQLRTRGRDTQVNKQQTTKSGPPLRRFTHTHTHPRARSHTRTPRVRVIGRPRVGCGRWPHSGTARHCSLAPATQLSHRRQAKLSCQRGLSSKANLCLTTQ
jgi:hypothetical protein